MRLTKQTSYAIRILIDCARADGRLVKVAEIAGRLDITQQNVFKIVHLLSRAGFVSAVRGRHGGVRLARPASDVRIGDVVRATEVTYVEVEREPLETRARAQPGTGINRVLDDALDAFISVLDQHTLSDMAAAASNKPLPPPGGGGARKRKAPVRAAAIGDRSERRLTR